MRPGVKQIWKYLLAIVCFGSVMLLLGYIFDILRTHQVITENQFGRFFMVLLGAGFLIGAWTQFDYDFAMKQARWFDRHPIMLALLTRWPISGMKHLKTRHKSKFVGIMMIIVGLIFIGSGVL